MKTLKHYARTFETIGYVQYQVNEEMEQMPEDQQLPAFVSFIDGKLTYLRVGATQHEVVENLQSCIEYRLYEEKDVQRLETSGIIEIHFEIPSHVKLDDKWRRQRRVEKEGRLKPKPLS